MRCRDADSSPGDTSLLARRPGYTIRPLLRKPIEEAFRWAATASGLAKRKFLMPRIGQDQGTASSLGNADQVTEN